MAVLGAQLVITLVMVSIIQKVGPHFSLARWLLCSTGLTRYLYPTDDELRTLSGVPKDKSKGKKGDKFTSNGKSGDTFHVSRSLEIQVFCLAVFNPAETRRCIQRWISINFQICCTSFKYFVYLIEIVCALFKLDTAKVSALDVVHLRFYTEYQWLVDFSVYTAVVYTLTEVYNGFVPIKDEVNLSMVWCLLVLGFALKLLVSLTTQYFQGNESTGERSTVIVSAFAYLVVAMMVLIVDEEILELGLNKAYTSFNQSAAEFMDAQGLDTNGPASKLVVKFSLAVWAAFVGALFTFPGLRMARMHWDSLKFCGENILLRILLNISFASPFLLVILWVKPISGDFLTNHTFPGMTASLMTLETFETIRSTAVVAAVVLRLCLMPLYLQAYLNMAYHRLEQQKKEAGRITNKDLQKKIAAVFYYLCVVTLQFVAPLLMCLYFSLMYKTLGGFSWTASHGSLLECPADEVQNQAAQEAEDTQFSEFAEETTIQQSAEQITMALDSLKQIFTADVYRGLFGFATWWTCFAWFATSSMGLVYQSYFSQS